MESEGGFYFVSRFAASYFRELDYVLVFIARRVN